MDPPLFVHYADLGDLNAVLPDSISRSPVEPSTFPVGIGVAADETDARHAALAEALERYSVYAWRDEQFAWSKLGGLEGNMLDLHVLPRCSEREQAHRFCDWQPPRSDASLRWVRGLSLTTGGQFWLPAVLVYLGISATPDERFTFANSTGCACHPSLTRAIITGLCEVIERDAVALTWLQRLSLPKIEFDHVPDWLRPYIAPRPDAYFERHFFDATTNLAVPTIYAVETARGESSVSTLVACATDIDPGRAVAKTVCDLSSHRLAVELERPLPNDPWMFTKSFEGCTFMARPEHQGAFRFLLNSARRRCFSDLYVPVDLSDEGAQLAWVLGRLASCDMEAYAVDLSPDEALTAGLHVVRTLIPDLMPVSFRLPVRYLAHPRLYEAPRTMRYPVYPEEEVNAWPQPFG